MLQHENGLVSWCEGHGGSVAAAVQLIIIQPSRNYCYFDMKPKVYTYNPFDSTTN